MTKFTFLSISGLYIKSQLNVDTVQPSYNMFDVTARNSTHHQLQLHHHRHRPCHKHKHRRSKCGHYGKNRSITRIN